MSLSLPRPCRLTLWVLSLTALLLCAMTLGRVVAYVLLVAPPAGTGEVASALWLGFRFDARVVAAVLLPLLVLGRFAWLDPFRHDRGRRLWFGVLGVIAAGLLLLYVSDFLHYRYVNQRLNATVLAFAADARLAAQMVWETYPVGWIVLGLLAGVLAMLWVMGGLHRWSARAAGSPGRGARLGWFTAVLLLGIVGIYGRVGQYPLRWSDAYALGSEAGANLALNPVESFTSSLTFRRTSFDPAKVRAHYPRMAAYLGVEAPDAARLDFARRVSPPGDGSGARPPNIVLVLCESFSSYKSSLWGNPLDTTPFFRELAGQGVLFDNCFTPHFGTARGVWALLTGIPDVSPVETASRNPAMVDQHTILNDFAGYEKYYFLGGSTSWANIRGLLTNNIRGLRLFEEGSYRSPRIDVWGISDKNLLLEADEILRREERPFFAIIQTADNHRPYTIPEEDLGEFQRIAPPAETVRQAGFESLAELNAFRYADYALEKFMSAARQSPYFDHTLFVFIGDHGIGGNAGSRFPAAWTARHLTRYHVPLLFYAPKLLPPRRLHAVASMVDVLPTLAGLARVSYRNTTLGRDLLAAERRDPGAGNAAFIIDHNDRTLGVLRGPWYALSHRDGRQAEVVWADFAGTDPGAPPAAAAAADLHALADAFYETSLYLLFNNRKSPGAAPLPAVRPPPPRP